MAPSDIRAVDPGWAWDDGLSFVPAIRAGGILYISGQLALNAKGTLVGGCPAGNRRYPCSRVKRSQAPQTEDVSYEDRSLGPRCVPDLDTVCGTVHADRLQTLPPDIQKAYENLDLKALVGPSSLRRIWLVAYALSGATSAVTGIALLGFSGGELVGVDDPYLFTTITATIIGGTSLMGGWDRYGSTGLGTLVLTILTLLLVGLGLTYATQQAVFGLLIVPIVAFCARDRSMRDQV